MPKGNSLVSTDITLTYSYLNYAEELHNYLMSKLYESQIFSSYNTDNLKFVQPDQCELAWLAGIIDGEGSVTIGARLRKKTNNLVLVPQVLITNTDKEIIKECERILNKMQLGYTINWIEYKHKDYLDRANIRITKYQRVKFLLEHLTPYLHSRKRHNAEVVLEFIADRESNLLTRDKLGHVHRNKYTKELITKVSSIRVHKRAISLEAMLNAANVV